MISQLLMDFVATLIALLIASIPPLPVEVTTAATWIADASTWLGTNLSVFGVLIPWGTVTMIVQWWVGLLTFWLAMVALRAVLTALGR